MYWTQYISRTWLPNPVLCLGLLLGVPSLLSTQACAQTPDAARLFGEHCATCHTGATRAPSLAHLTSMPARAILQSLVSGRMAQHADSLDQATRQAIAELLSGRNLENSAWPAAARCDGRVPVRGRIAWSGWGGGPGETGYKTARAAGITASDVRNLELAWVLAIPGATQTRNKPALVGDHVILATVFGDVMALRRETGCIEWQIEVDAAVRGAITVAPREDGGLTAYFADFLTNVYAVDVEHGRLIWKSRVGRHPQHGVTGSVAVDGPRVFVPLTSMEVATALDPRYDCCSSSGAVVALSTTDGTELWFHRVIADSSEAAPDQPRHSGAPVWSSPTVDAERGLLYFGTGENYTRPTSDNSDAIQAVDLETGRVVWTFQATVNDAYNIACGPPPGPNCPSPTGPDFDFGMAPILVTRSDGKDILVVGQKSGIVYALDPDANGAVVWSTRVGRGGALGGIHWGMASDGRYVYAPVSDRYDGGLGGDAIVGPARPGLHALDLMTGDEVWSASAPDTCGDNPQCFAAFSSAPTAIEGAVFQGGLDGRLRAYSSADGQLLWEFDTATEFEGIGGLPGTGGALDAAGPVVADGFVLVNAGYGAFGQMPGNVVLAFHLRP